MGLLIESSRLFRLHLMLIGIREPLMAGQTLPLELRFGLPTRLAPGPSSTPPGATP